MTDLTTKPNAELAYRVLDHIDAHPESWNQGIWVNDCGTAACAAGWAVMLSGETIDRRTVVQVGRHRVSVADRAAQLLGFRDEEHMVDVAYEALGMEALEDDINDMHEYLLFAAGNDREDLGRIVEALFGPRPDGGA